MEKFPVKIQIKKTFLTLLSSKKKWRMLIIFYGPAIEHLYIVRNKGNQSLLLYLCW